MYKRSSDNRCCCGMVSVPDAAKVAHMIVAALDKDEIIILIEMEIWIKD